uniref:Uncharacterized protein n=1 Tax=Panagrolaimus sp. JU765 TaxID=591449 RepID=A0AC34Q5Q8_9BILA
VISCRACASFYRRSIKAKKKYLCQKGTGKCNLKSQKRSQCRFCRFKKCQEMGMIIDLTENERFSICPDLPDQSTSPKGLNLEFTNWKLKCPDWPTISLFFKNCLCQKPEYLKNKKMPEIQRFQIGLQKLLNFSWPLPEVKIVKEIHDPQIVIDFYSEYLTNVAQMLTYSEFFMKLNIDDRFALFKHFWFNFISIERLYTFCQFRGYDSNDTLYLLDNKHLIESNGFSLQKLTKEEKQKHQKIHEPLAKIRYTYINVPFKTMQITLTEFIFLCYLILWDVKLVQNLSSKAISLGNEVISKVSDEMHDYYTNELHNPAYATRIIKLTKLAADVQRMRENQRQITTLAQIFGLFNILDNELMD